MTAASCSVILEYSADEVIVSFAATLYSFLLMSGTGSMSKAAIDQTLENLKLVACVKLSVGFRIVMLFVLGAASLDSV